MEKEPYYRYIRAVDKAGNISEPIRKTIKVDKSKPTIDYELRKGSSSGSKAQSDVWYNTNIHRKLITFDSVSGIEKVYYSTDGEKWSDETNVDSRTFGEGINNTLYRVKDNAGNYSDPIRIIIKVDKTPPDVVVGNFYHYTDHSNQIQKRLNFTSITDNLSGFDSYTGFHIDYWHTIPSDSGSSGKIWYDNNFFLTFGYADRTENVLKMNMTFTDVAGNATKVNLQCNYSTNKCSNWNG